MKSKAVIKEELTDVAKKVCIKFGHRIVNVEFTLREAKLKANCKRCDWCFTMVEKAAGGYFFIISNNGETQAMIVDSDKNPLLSYDRYLDNVCPKISSML